MRWNRTYRRSWQDTVIAALLFTCIALVPACQPGESDAPGSEETIAPTVVYLVRHAEKALENPEDPALSEAGQARADLLVQLLADAGIDAVWSTDTRRTRSTAAPAAQASAITVELYDPRGMPAFASMLKQRGGRHLIVGHSNTTPAFVEALGGDPISEIVEEEYDRLYIVTVAPDGHVETVLLRFGEPYTAM